MITKNEKNVLRYLILNYYSKSSINKIAKDCKLAPNGAYKILKKFEKEGVLKFSRISNLKLYYLDFKNSKTKSIIEVALMPETTSKRIKYRAKDLEPLKELTLACALFGSYAANKEKASDLDVFFLIGKNNYSKYKEKLREIKGIVPVKIHDLVQTEQDLKDNIKKENKVIFNILKEGIFLWGYDKIIKVLADVS